MRREKLKAMASDLRYCNDGNSEISGVAILSRQVATKGPLPVVCCEGAHDTSSASRCDQSKCNNPIASNSNTHTLAVANMANTPVFRFLGSSSLEIAGSGSTKRKRSVARPTEPDVMLSICTVPYGALQASLDDPTR
jgi:hypothetical protein